MVLVWVQYYQPSGTPAAVILAESSWQHIAVQKSDDSYMFLSLPSSPPIFLPKAAFRPKIALWKSTTACAVACVLLWVRKGNKLGRLIRGRDNNLYKLCVCQDFTHLESNYSSNNCLHQDACVEKHESNTSFWVVDLCCWLTFDCIVAKVEASSTVLPDNRALFCPLRRHSCQHSGFCWLCCFEALLMFVCSLYWFHPSSFCFIFTLATHTPAKHSWHWSQLSQQMSVDGGSQVFWVAGILALFLCIA